MTTHPLTTEVTPQCPDFFNLISCCRPTKILMGNRGILPICWERLVYYFDESYIDCTHHSINHSRPFSTALARVYSLKITVFTYLKLYNSRYSMMF